MKLSFSPDAFLKRFTYGANMRPARDWFLMLLIAVLLVAGSIGWNFWLFQSVEQGAVIGESSTGRTGLDERSVEPVRRVFESRQEEQNRYRNEYRFVDPSL